MLFNSLQFVIFFFVVLLVYYVIPKKIRWVWLLITSYIFYMAWNVKYVVLLLGMTGVTYLIGLLIEKTQSGKMRENTKKYVSRICLVVAILCNMGLLVYFKYMNMFSGWFTFFCNKLGIAVTGRTFDILLPVGISFISFQSLGYVIDVYKRKVKAEKNPFKYALFIAFFPQLVAGPIERSENLLTQIQNIHKQKRISYEKFTNGFILMLFGYFQKIVVGDKLGVFVDTVFATPEAYNSLILVLGAVAFTIQIYCDFGGYSNIAIGAAQVLGFDMMENFNAPYFATSIKDFWRRWHISLSSWFRDYVYIPLGGNRKGIIRKYINLMITFLVSGLWHGAHVHFIIWGGIHGAYQVIGDMARTLIQKIKTKHRIPVNTEVFSFKVLQMIVTFALVTFAWIFFRAESIPAAFTYIRQMCTAPDIGVLFNGAIFQAGLNANDVRALMLCLLILFATDFVRYHKNMRIEKYLCTQNLWFKWAVLLLVIVCIVVFGEYGLNYDASEFIYFQF